MQASYILKRPPLETRVEVKMTMTVRDLHAAAAGAQKITSDAGLFSITVADRRAVERLADVLAKVAESVTDHLEDLETEVRVELEEAWQPAADQQPCQQRMVPRYEREADDDVFVSDAVADPDDDPPLPVGQFLRKHGEV